MSANNEVKELELAISLDSLVTQYFSCRLDLLEYVSYPSETVSFDNVVSNFSNAKLELNKFLVDELKCSYIKLSSSVVFVRGNLKYVNEVNSRKGING